MLLQKKLRDLLAMTKPNVTYGDEHAVYQLTCLPSTYSDAPMSGTRLVAYGKSCRHTRSYIQSEHTRGQLRKECLDVQQLCRCTSKVSLRRLRTLDFRFADTL